MVMVGWAYLSGWIGGVACLDHVKMAGRNN